MDNDTSFGASKLGTKQYWDDAYQTELENFEEFGDEGEIWFGKQCEKRIVEWCSTSFPKDAVILDIGSGNGHLSLSLARKGFTNLTGLDYSNNAVTLGEALFANHPEVKDSAMFISSDFLEDTLPDKYDLMLDKGTFDAISLMPSEEDTPESRAKHIDNLSTKFKTALLAIWSGVDARFIITSCNWTRSELERLFGPIFVVCHQIEHPAFNFGGASGQTVTTLVFQRSQ